MNFVEDSSINSESIEKPEGRITKESYSKVNASSFPVGPNFAFSFLSGALQGLEALLLLLLLLLLVLLFET